MNPLSLLSDQPLGEETPIDADGLGFNTYANVLASAAKHSVGPFTIGVLGEWGTGKTSLLQMVEHHFKGDEDVLTVWFNAWRFGNEEHPIIPLVSTIIEQLDRPSTGNKLAKIADDLTTILLQVAAGFSAKFKLPGLSGIEFGYNADNTIEPGDENTGFTNEERSIYFHAFEQLKNLNLPDNSRIIVFIDDLDRCLPDTALKLLESIKLLLSQPGFIFILGISRDAIEGYLNHRYQQRYGLGANAGRMYLDKLIQLPFYIPPNTNRLDDFTDKIIERLGTINNNNLPAEVVKLVCLASGGNPRATIRFVNNLLVDDAINSELSSQKLMDKIEIEYFAVTRCLQQNWYSNYTLLSSSNELCEQAATWTMGELSDIALADDNNVASLASDMITDKELANLLLSEYGKNWLVQAEKRNATIDFVTSRHYTLDYSNDLPKKLSDITLVYSHKDRKQVLDIADILSNEKIKVMLGSQDGNLGKSIAADWDQQLASAKNVGFCISDDFEESMNNEDSDISIAIDAAIRKSRQDNTFSVIPILLPGTTTTNNDNLRRLQWLKLETIAHESLQKLITHLKRRV